MAMKESDLETGFESIDADHQLQADIVKTLENAVRRGADREIVQGILLGLLQSHDEHFRSETELMREFGYPIESSEEHEQAHQLLLRELGDLKLAYAEGRLEVTLETVASLNARLVDHIHAMDRALADFLKAHDHDARGPAKE